MKRLFLALSSCLVVAACAGDQFTNGAGSTGSGGGTTGVTTGAGGAQACTSPDECPNPDSVCKLAACNEEGRCLAVNAPQGFQPPQTDGDCHTVAPCTGDGTPQLIDEPNDVIDDGNPCTSDVCTDDTPQHVPMVGATCSEGAGVCGPDGVCVQCNSPADCDPVPECQYSTCARGACGVGNKDPNTPCSDGDVCNGTGQCGDCVEPGDCGPTTECQAPSCTAGLCSPNYAAPGHACAGGTKQCNGTGQCVDCILASDCGAVSECATPKCSGGICGVIYADEGKGCVGAGNGGYCNGAGDCVQCLDAGDCGVATECVTPSCQQGSCQVTFADIGTPCANSTNQCNGSGLCVDCTDDKGCVAPAVCVQFFCIASSEI
jgi:hypothetical protein